MKVKIQNMSMVKRGVPTPSNVSIPIEANGFIELEAPAGFEKFYRGLEQHSFKVTIDRSSDPVEEPNKVEEKKVVKEEPKKVVKDEPKDESKVVEEPKEESKVESVEEKVEDELTVEEIIKDKLPEATVDQLKAICEKLGIETTSNNKNNLISKIDKSSASDDQIVTAFKEVVGK